MGEQGVDAFTMMKIARHSSITTSQKYSHPSSEALERAFERLEASRAKRDVTKSVTNHDKEPEVVRDFSTSDFQAFETQPDLIF